MNHNTTPIRCSAGTRAALPALALGACMLAAFSGGCASSAQTGAVAGGGIGALMGQAIGRNTTGTLIGAAVGTGAGYMIGNEMDRSAARDEQARRDAERARRDRQHEATIRDLEANQARLESQSNAQAQTTGTFVPPAWPSSTQQMQPLADTAWRVSSMTPPPRRQFNSMTLHFHPNGHVVSNTHYADGHIRVDSETFRIVGNTLIINGSDYLTNSTWSISGNQMTLVNQGFRTTLDRIGDGD